MFFLMLLLSLTYRINKIQIPFSKLKRNIFSPPIFRPFLPANIQFENEEISFFLHYLQISDNSRICDPFSAFIIFTLLITELLLSANRFQIFSFFESQNFPYNPLISHFPYSPVLIDQPFRFHKFLYVHPNGRKRFDCL